MMEKITLDLVIPADEWLKLYKGSIQVVRATSRDGKKVRFPANILHKFVTRGGIQGSFEIYFDKNGKFQSITRL
jgi:hypothetical protein